VFKKVLFSSNAEWVSAAFAAETKVDSIKASAAGRKHPRDKRLIFNSP